MGEALVSPITEFITNDWSRLSGAGVMGPAFPLPPCSDVVDLDSRVGDVAEPRFGSFVQTPPQQLPNRRGVSAGKRPSRARGRGPPRACPRSVSRPQTRRVRSASRRARNRTPRCRCACRPAARAPAPGSCRRRCRGRTAPRVVAVSVGDCDASLAGAVAGDAFARPKSSTLTMPSGVILMLAGFRSRWTMPFSCAASSASAICRAIVSASASGRPLPTAPAPMRSASVGPRRAPGPARDAVGLLERRRSRRCSDG